MRLVCLLAFCLVSGFITIHAAESSTPSTWPDPATFAMPPSQYGVETWWHWINGNVSKAGITKDLEAMREQGIPRATMLAVGMGPEGPVNPLLSDVWLDHWRFAVAEASRLGLKLSTHIGPGWSCTGGPWITPENSMKRLVWSQQIVTGGASVELDLPPLPATRNWSKDIAVLAWPSQATPSRMLGVTVQNNGQPADAALLYDGNPATGLETNEPTKWTLQFSFPKPHMCDRAQFFVRWKVHGPSTNKYHLRVLADDKLAHETEIDGSRFNGTLTIPFPAAITASSFKFEWEIVGHVEGWQTLRFVQMAEVELLSGSERPQWLPELQNLAQQIGDAPGAGTCNWLKGDSRPIQAAQIIDLTDKVKNGHLSWAAPAGSWRIVRLGFTTTGKGASVPQKGGDGLETDKLSTAATDLHFNTYLKPMIEAIPPAQRSTFDTVLMDSWEVGLQNWTDDFATEFQKRRGYALTPYFAALAGEVVGSREETERFLNDFRETISDLLTERFFARNAELLHQHHLQFSAELSDNEPPVNDYFALARIVDQPMDEFWSDKSDGTLPPPTATVPRRSLAAEGAYVAGKPVVGAEAFTSWSADFRRTPGDFGFLADNAMLWGYNRLVLHSYVHQPADIGPGWTLGRHGQAFNRLNTWWPMIGDWLREVSRMQYLGQTSVPAYDVLVYYGDSMPRPRPDNVGLPAGTRPLRIDRVALAQLKVVDGNKLTLTGSDRYVALIVPSNRLRADTVETFARLLKDGAIIAAPRPGKAPGWSNHEEQDQRIETVARSTWDSSSAWPKNIGSGKLYRFEDIAALLRDAHYRPDISSIPADNSPASQPLLAQHRRSGAIDLYGLLNPNDKPDTFAVSIVDNTTRTPALWNPVTGRVTPVDFRRENNTLVLTLPLESRRLVSVVLSPKAVPAATPANEPGPTFAITTPFSVTFSGLNGLPAQSLQPPTAWSDSDNPRIRDYSGIAIYRTEFTLPANYPTGGTVTLDLGDVSRVARVTVNDQHIGTLWRAPWRIEVGPQLKPGRNTLQIEVANTWLNQLLADGARPKSERTLFTTWGIQPWLDAKVPREKSGLFGPVTLQAFTSPRKN